ncbi:MAG: PD-(D/E)XK nuclease family protein, partial [Opitutaceae bacterium]
MVPAPPSVRRRFLPWDRPLLPQIVEELAEGWDRSGPLDLSRILAIVPTRQAGRKLREALAVHAAIADRAAFPPRVLTPEGLLNVDLPDAAPRLRSILAWTDVLRRAHLEEFRDVFPLDPPSRPFTWGLRLAQQFIALQANLADIGWRICDLGRATESGDIPEAERWRALAVLERRYDAALAAEGLRDAQAAKIAAAGHAAAPAGIERILVLGIPDPIPLALNALAGLALSVPVEILVFAPSGETGAFDEWGRPIESVWAERPLALGDLPSRLRLEADPEAQAERIAALVEAYGAEDPAADHPTGTLAVGIVDPELFAPIESGLARVDRPAFNPEGRPWREGGLYALLAAAAGLLRDPSFAAVEALARHPDFLAHARHRIGSRFSAARWLAGLDELRARHLPADLPAARAHAPGLPGFPELAPGLAVVADFRDILRVPDFAVGVVRA